MLKYECVVCNLGHVSGQSQTPPDAGPALSLQLLAYAASGPASLGMYVLQAAQQRRQRQRRCQLTAMKAGKRAQIDGKKWANRCAL